MKDIAKRVKIQNTHCFSIKNGFLFPDDDLAEEVSLLDS